MRSMHHTVASAESPLRSRSCIATAQQFWTTCAHRQSRCARARRGPRGSATVCTSNELHQLAPEFVNLTLTRLIPELVGEVRLRARGSVNEALLIAWGTSAGTGTASKQSRPQSILLHGAISKSWKTCLAHPFSFKPRAGEEAFA